MEGQIVLVYGSGGIGSAMVRAFLKKKYKVYLLGHNPLKLKEAAKQLNLPANQVLAVPSLLEEEEFKKVENWLTKEKVELSAVVHAIGYASSQLITNMGLIEWQESIDVNLHSCFALYKVADTFFSKKQYEIVFFSSYSLENVWIKNSVYGASKAGLEYMSQTLQQEIKDKGGRVWLYRVGSVDTPFFDNIKSHLPKHKRIEADKLASWVVSNFDLPAGIFSPMIKLTST